MYTCLLCIPMKRFENEVRSGNAEISKLRACFFFYGSLFLLTEPKFHSRLTLSSNNSRSKPHTPNKFHIFGIVRTSAFRWTYPGFFSLSKFRGTSVLWEKVFFCIFAWPHRENFQVAADRTILTPAGFPIAHLKAYALRFSGNIWKMSVVLKLGVPALPEVSWSGFVSKKNAVLKALFFGENPRSDWLRPNVDLPLKGRVTLPKRLNFRKSSKRPVTPPPSFSENHVAEFFQNSWPKYST